VGATIHMLSKGLDSGDMLFHCLPKYIEGDTPFDFTMRSVLAAHYGLCESISDCSIFSAERVSQNKSKELRSTKNADFTDVEANEFLLREYSINSQSLTNYPQLLKPRFY
jgi:hypothetical protein